MSSKFRKGDILKCGGSKYKVINVKNTDKGYYYDVINVKGGSLLPNNGEHNFTLFKRASITNWKDELQ